MSHNIELWGFPDAGYMYPEYQVCMGQEFEYWFVPPAYKDSGKQFNLRHITSLKSYTLAKETKESLKLNKKSKSKNGISI